MKIFKDAKLTLEQTALIPSYIDGSLDFYGTPAYEKLYEYFTAETGEMPYGIAKARDGDPDFWILETIEGLTNGGR